jgi:hypothetical protein
MLLTEEEFSWIRPLTWKSTVVGGRIYQTTADAIDTRLFWLDFLRLVFAPKYRRQGGITAITDFDVDRQVLLTDCLELMLPTEVETAMYYANNPTPPVTFEFSRISQTVVLFVTLAIIVLIVVASSVLRVPFARII